MNFRNEIFRNVLKMKEDLQEQISENEKYVSEMNAALDKDISDVRTLATDTMKQSNKEILDRFEGQF